VNEPDEETKEQPAFAQPGTPAEPGQPTTTIDTPPPTVPGTIPPAPGMSLPGPSYQPPTPPYPQQPAAGWPAQPPMPGQPMQGVPPAQGWQQGPGGYPAQPQGQWQQPGYGAPPGYGPQGYGAAPGWAAAQPWGTPAYKTSILVALAGLLLITFGLAVALLGGWTLTQGPELGRFIRDNDIAIFGTQIQRDTLKAILEPMPGILMVLGVLQLLVGAVVLAHRGWARWLGVLLALFGLLVSVVALSAVLALVPGVSVQLGVAAVLLLGYAYIVLALIAGGSHFRVRAPGR
jgi:hypothetical protein